MQRMQQPVFQVYAFAVLQGGKIQIGAPTGRWQMIVVYRGKHDPVSRNYLVALGQVRFWCSFSWSGVSANMMHSAMHRPGLC